jgi:Protein of unknown function (DUF2934)
MRRQIMATAQVSPRKGKAIRRAPQTSETPQVSEEQIQDIQENIRERAYQLFLERGSEHGHHLEDWLRAEAEIRSIRESFAA